MTFDKLLVALEKRNITPRLKDGKIAVPKGTLTNALRMAIIAHKPELIRHLQAEQVPVAAPTDEPFSRKIPGAIRLQHAINWFNEASRKIPMADRGRQKARITLPSSCRWLLDWLPKDKRVEFEKRGDLAWTDWNAVVGEVRGKFENDLEA